MNIALQSASHAEKNPDYEEIDKNNNIGNFFGSLPGVASNNGGWGVNMNPMFGANNIFGQSIASNQAGNNNQNNGNVFINGVLQNPSTVVATATQPPVNIAQNPALSSLANFSQPSPVMNATQLAPQPVVVSSTATAQSNNWLGGFLSQLSNGNVFHSNNIIGQNNNQGNVGIINGVIQQMGALSPAFAPPSANTVPSGPVALSQPPVQIAVQSSTVTIATQPSVSTAVVGQASANTSVAQQTLISVQPLSVDLAGVGVSLGVANATISDNSKNATLVV
jgi:hypothetical protein